MKSPLLLLLLLSLPAAATETRWTATGTVTSVTGTGLAATVGAPISLKFSYDSGGTMDRKSSFAFYSLTYYFGAVQLAMETTIGGSKWTASGPVTQPGDVISVEAYNGPTDTLRLTASTALGVTFPTFPYTGSATDRRMRVTLQDNHSPSLFLVPNGFPDDSSVVTSISSGSGEIKAGSDVIAFSINPASVTVETGTPFKVAIETTATGVKLRWPTVADQLYLIMESDDCIEWEFSDSITGNGQEKVYEISNAFAINPRRRFYQIVAD